MYFRFLILAIFILSQSGLNQEKSVDSLLIKSYEYLEQAFYDNQNNYKIATLYVDAAIKKAKIEKDTFYLAYAYLNKSYILNYKDAIVYSDSIIALTANFKNEEFPALGYMLKGYHEYVEGNDEIALDLYLKAYDYALQNDNSNQQIEINQFVGSIKNDFGQYDEALKIFRKQLNFIKSQSNYKQELTSDYIFSLNDLSKAYLRGRILDSAAICIKEGIDFSVKVKDSSMYSSFLLDSGTLLYFENDYENALDSLKKAEPLVNGISLANCYYYQGKIFAQTDMSQTIDFFDKVDSIYTAIDNPFIELRDVYKMTYDFYSQQGDVNKQLFYMDKLIKIDSLLNKTIKNINNEVVQNYEVPKLKSEKKKLVDQINQEQILNERIVVLGIFVVLLLLGVSLLLYINQKRYKKRFDALLRENSNTKNRSTKPKVKGKSINISKENVDHIISKLDEFEREKQYLEKGITLNKLAKEFESNSMYLSKVINHYKDISFSNYLSGLRIDHCIKELKTNHKLRAYTIKAISSEVGFSNSESFSKAFFHKTGIKPSFFIKQLNKLTQNS